MIAFTTRRYSLAWVVQGSIQTPFECRVTASRFKVRERPSASLEQPAALRCLHFNPGRWSGTGLDARNNPARFICPRSPMPHQRRPNSGNKMESWSTTPSHHLCSRRSTQKAIASKAHLEAFRDLTSFGRDRLLGQFCLQSVLALPTSQFPPFVGSNNATSPRIQASPPLLPLLPGNRAHLSTRRRLLRTFPAKHLPHAHQSLVPCSSNFTAQYEYRAHSIGKSVFTLRPQWSVGVEKHVGFDSLENGAGWAADCRLWAFI